MKLKKWKKFEKFLKKEGAFEKYYQDIARDGDGLSPHDGGDPTDYIVGAFRFRETKGGGEYWWPLNNKWLKELEK